MDKDLNDKYKNPFTSTNNNNLESNKNISNNNDNEFNQIKLDYIKTFLDNHLENLGVYNKLKDEFTNENLNDEDLILKKLKDEGIIDNIMEGLGKWGEDNSVKLKNKSQQKGMFIKFTKISEFNEFAKSDPDMKLEIDILFLGQRFQTKPVFVNTDMYLEQGFFLDFNPTKLDIKIDLDNLLRLSSPVHLVLMSVSTDPLTGEIKKSLLATKSIEWRWILAYGSWKISTDLYSAKATSGKIHCGVLGVTISILPLVEKRSLLPEKAVLDHINTEKKYLNNSHQDFVKYANDWWEDYKNSKGNSNRLIKLFLTTDDKETFSYKPACSLLFPITTGRSLSTPYDAARFVSLIPYAQSQGLNNTKEEVYNSLHTFLSLKSGDVEDHSILLCNILLGFGLDAYIAIGLCINGPHTWVITRGIADVQNNSNSNPTKVYTITFWESLTGQRILISDPKVFRFYKKIHCVFSDKNFYANLQPDDTVFNTSYVFEDEFLWKKLLPEKIDSIVKYNFSPELCLNKIITDIHSVEDEIEKDLKTKIVQFRRSLDLGTQIDNKLGYLLSPALCNYELERISSSTYGNEEFKQSIKNYVPEGFTFKAFPCHHTNFDVNTFWSLCLTSEIGKDILYTKGDSIKFAVRCKIYQYPQDIFSCWVMFGVKYRAIK